MPYSVYSGGYSKDKKAQLEAIKIPDKVKCKVCKKLKPIQGFSKRQLSDLQQRMAQNPALGAPSSAVIICRLCTPGQTHELECAGCLTFKSLDDFSKAQRRNRDHARCIRCVKEDLQQPAAGDEDFCAPGEVAKARDDDIVASDTEDGETSSIGAVQGGVKVPYIKYLNKQVAPPSEATTSTLPNPVPEFGNLKLEDTKMGKGKASGSEAKGADAASGSDLSDDDDYGYI